MATGGCIRCLGRWPEPQVVLESRRYWFWLLMLPGLRVVGAPSRQSNPGNFQLTNAPIAHQLARTAEPGIGALLAPGLEDDPRLGHCIAHGSAFSYRQRERLLAVDILPGLTRLDYWNRVPVVGRANFN